MFKGFLPSTFMFDLFFIPPVTFICDLGEFNLWVYRDFILLPELFIFKSVLIVLDLD